MKKIIHYLLVQKVKRLLAKHRPLIVGVTGSVGKTSTRNAIAKVLEARFHVGKTIKNYNNEFGLPLSILGMKSPGKSIWGWVRVLLSAPSDVPSAFVLEYGVDTPGDMTALCKIVSPHISVFTRVSPVHAERFDNVEQLAREKSLLLAVTDADGLCVMNGDDPLVMQTREVAQAPVVTYGFLASNTCVAHDYLLKIQSSDFYEPNQVYARSCVSITSSHQETYACEFSQLIGKAAVSSVLPAIVIGEHLGIPHEMISAQLQQIHLEPGRMSVIPGIKGSLILDGSYNAAPAAVHAALDVLAQFSPVETARRIAVLGSMAELGGYSENEHHIVGLKVQESGVDVLVTIGERAQDIRQSAIQAGMDETMTYHFDTSVLAGRWLDSEIRKGDIILVKGAQSMRTERVVKDIMAEPLRAHELLVRQEKEWV